LRDGGRERPMHRQGPGEVAVALHRGPHRGASGSRLGGGIPSPLALGFVSGAAPGRRARVIDMNATARP